MRVLITGGAGLVGRPICQRFVELGWDVRVIGLEPACDLTGVTYAQCDIRDFDALLGQVQGCEAVAHLAAIPSTRSHPNPTLFDINVAGTFNIFEATARAGVKRVVQASSINALGGYWGCDDRRFDYFPLDEDHPVCTTDAYSFSKQLNEETADYFWRRAGISSISLRLPAVWSDDIIEARGLRRSFREKRRALDRFRQLPTQEQQRRLAAVRERVLHLRARHIQEFDAIQSGAYDREASLDDWLFSSYFFDRFNYWTFIHTDDAAQAFERAVTADIKGAHSIFVNSERNYLAYESEALLSLFFPEVERRVNAITGDAALVSIDRARDLIGFRPTVNSV